MTKRLRSLGWILLLVLGAAAVASRLLAPRELAPAAATLGTVAVEAFGTGAVESRRTVELGAEVSGRITSLAVDQGDRVTAGQVVLGIDDEIYRAEAALAREEVALAESALARTDAEVERAAAVLEGAAANLDRVRPLVESRVMSASELDDARERHKVALAEEASARAARVEARVALATSRRRLERAEADLARTRVAAPFDGLVLRRLREVGDVAVPGAGVLRLAATDTIWASVWVDEIYLGRLAPGQPARIVLRSAPDATLTGTLARVGREVDRETRELLVDVAFDEPPADLVMGQRVDLWILLERAEGVLRVPLTHLVRQDGEEGVRVVEDGRARFRPVEVGLRGREFVEVRGGLEAGAEVLPRVDGRGRAVQSGDRVRAVPAAEAER